MTYNTPELLLAGAAQNLVLDTSEFQLKNGFDCKLGPNDQDGPGATYDGLTTW